jgi:hypothetical protein
VYRIQVAPAGIRGRSNLGSSRIVSRPSAARADITAGGALVIERSAVLSTARTESRTASSATAEALIQKSGGGARPDISRSGRQSAQKTRCANFSAGRGNIVAHRL